MVAEAFGGFLLILEGVSMERVSAKFADWCRCGFARISEKVGFPSNGEVIQTTGLGYSADQWRNPSATDSIKPGSTPMRLAGVGSILQFFTKPYPLNLAYRQKEMAFLT